MKTSGNVVLITGGSAGIGLALARKFISEHNRVIVVGRSPERLQAAKATCPGIETEVADVSGENEIRFLAQKYKDVNVLINNAGVQFLYDFLEDPDCIEKMQAEVDTNLIAPMKLIYMFSDILKKNKDSVIINVSSGLGIVPKKSAPVYCATKAAVHIFTRALRDQLETTSVRVFEIIPPVVDTEMTRGRGKKKISPEQLADAFWKNFKTDTEEIWIGRTRLLKQINRFFPGLAGKIMKNS